jgi:Leucine-rich repeat (LRR) protein
MNGDGWYNNTGWGTDTSYCEWYGVTCDADDHVRILDLDRNWLTGALPSEIGDLPMLTVLRLTGTTSSTKIGDIIYAKLSGPLPPEMGNLANLQTLYLDLNDFVSLPPEIGNLSNLQLLTLGSNQLTSLPPEPGNLPNLQWLYLSYNQLTFLPPELGNLPILQELDLSYNKLSGPTPAFLRNLGNLSALYLTGNPLSCWEMEEARDWALSLDVYVGSTCFFP